MLRKPFIDMKEIFSSRCCEYLMERIGDVAGGPGSHVFFRILAQATRGQN